MADACSGTCVAQLTRRHDADKCIPSSSVPADDEGKCSSSTFNEGDGMGFGWPLNCGAAHVGGMVFNEVTFLLPCSCFARLDRWFASLASKKV